MVTAYVALGSNIDEREVYLSNALNLLEGKGEITITKRSSVYETDPVGYTDQNEFLNMVVEVETLLSPYQLLDVCQSIEEELGRKRVVKWGPRTIDLDILLYNDENIEVERLRIPHPHMHERAFVMVPLAELNGQVRLSSINRNAQEVLESMPEAEKAGIRIWGRL
ncbi:2-amino-4-hydroxy-6-hydroxymethyldihydropteridine diphosphokinase [Halobacillus rhizosphaerae]|uniref:2-amino-4-hydroxy-6- hydroxymethyldihydropteridine diphosphokinase n=1 Tax=Halobacillus rhizosphaerae TaxID=3064889 RepID=UPI00398AB969